MSDRWVLFVAVDSYLDASLGAVPYAESAARTAADLLAAAGWPKKQHVALLGSHATKGAIESRVRKLRRGLKKGDRLLVWVDAHAFSHKGASSIAAWDTSPDDLIDSGVSLAGVVKELTAAKAAEVVFLLDVGAGPLPKAAWPDGVAPHLDFEELDRLFADSPKAVALTATVDDQESHTAAALKGSVWTFLLLEALAGRGAKALTPDGTVTAASLHRYLEDELPRLLRKHFDGRTDQTPRLFGDATAGAVVADLSASAAAAGGPLLEPSRLKRIAFRTESHGRVRDLSGFRKTFKLPEHAGPSARSFVAKCAADDVRADLDEVFEAVRANLGYKRKEIDSSTGAGMGALRTPDFEYTVSMALDPADPTQVIWTRELGQLADAGFVRTAGFEAAFGRLFDQLRFEFASPVDVEAVVDRLEDDPPAGVGVAVASDGAACDVTLAGFAGAVRVERAALTIRGRAGTVGGLLDQFLEFVRRVGPLGEPLALPAKG